LHVAVVIFLVKIPFFHENPDQTDKFDKNPDYFHKISVKIRTVFWIFTVKSRFSRIFRKFPNGKQKPFSNKNNSLCEKVRKGLKSGFFKISFRKLDPQTAQFPEISCRLISGLAGLQATNPKTGTIRRDRSQQLLPGRRDGRRRRPEPFSPNRSVFPILHRLFFALSASAPNPRVLSLRSSVPAAFHSITASTRTPTSARLFAPSVRQL
jgi:hypothetical protein